MASAPLIPELLAPAGNMEKLKTAILYGADAVYVAGEAYSLRAGAANFSMEELPLARSICRSAGVRMYVTINGMLFDWDLDALNDYLDYLQALEVDGLIVADLGVVTLIRQRTSLAVHVSTQMSTLNAQSASFWQDFGVKRLVLARECTLEDVHHLSKATSLELEVFVHGALCLSSSGQCTLSNYTAGRDANRGGCNQTCRFRFSSASPLHSTTPLSSKDLMTALHLDQVVGQGIHSLKIEGRMKTPFYLATVVRVYRRLLNEIAKTGRLSQASRAWAQGELERVNTRGYTGGVLLHQWDQSTISEAIREPRSGSPWIARVQDRWPSGQVVLQGVAPLTTGHRLVVLGPEGDQSLTLDTLQDFKGKPLETLPANGFAVIPHTNLQPGMVLRREEPHGVL
jgi:putative protease